VAVPVPATGDLPLTPAFRRFAARVVAPCAATLPWIAASDRVLARLLPATLPREPNETTAMAMGDTPPSTLTAWLLAIALAAAVTEMFVRRGAGANATA
jgi:hypothetical protein